MEAFIRLRAEQQEVEEEEEMLPQVTAGVEGVAGGGACCIANINS